MIPAGKAVPPALPAADAAAPPIPVAVIGFGRMGQRHARALARVPGLHLVGAVDPDPGHAAAAAHLGLPLHDSLDAVLPHARAAVIAVPTEHHASVFEPLARQGIDCLVEKPVGASLAELERMGALAARHGTRVFAGYCERFHPTVRALQARLDRGPCHVEVRRLAVPAPGRHFGIDVLLDLLVHDLDWLYCLLDEEPEEALLESTRSPAGQIEEVTCRLRFPGALQARLTASRIARARRRDVSVTLADGALGEFDLDAPPASGTDDNLTAQARAFAAALRGEPSTLIAGLDDARRVLSLVERLRLLPARGREPVPADAS